MMMEEQNDTAREQAPFLTFYLGEEYFAIPVMAVKEIVEVLPITPLPHAPDFLKGIANLRGRVIPIVDTRIKFGLSPCQYSRTTRIIVIELLQEGESLEIGALVDGSKEVVEYELQNIQEPPHRDEFAYAEFIKGVVQTGDQFTMVIDAHKIFSPNEIASLAGQSAEAPTQ